MVNKVAIEKVFKEGIEISLNDIRYHLSFDKYPWFKYCSLQEIYNVESDGIGIYWKDADIDLEIEMLAKDDVSIISLDKWLEYRKKKYSREYGRMSGRAKSPNKKRSSILNGRKGGRPRIVKKLVHA